MVSHVRAGWLVLLLLPGLACAGKSSNPSADGGSTVDGGHPSAGDAGMTCAKAPPAVTSTKWLILQGADNATGAADQELAQRVKIPKTGQAGSVSLILQRMGPGMSAASHDLLIDLYPASSQMPPTPECNSAQPVAHAQFDTSVLEYKPDGGISAQSVTINFTSDASSMLNAGDTYVMHFHLSPGAIDEIGLATTASVSSQGGPPNSVTGTTTFSRVLSSTDTCACAPAWVTGTDEVSSFFYIGGGCSSGATTTCGKGICTRTVSNCDAQGNPQVCVPGACKTDADCCPASPVPGKITIDCSTYTCNQATGICNPHAEVCDGLDDNCDGMLDNGLPTLDCDGGCSVYSCGENGLPTKCPAICYAPDAGSPDAGSSDGGP